MKAFSKFCIFGLIVLCSLVRAVADGFIVVPPPHPQPPPHPAPGEQYSFAPLEVKFHRVAVKISEQTAHTSVDQEFYNPSDRRLEGMYIFPLPKGAHIDSFAMDVDGEMMAAELLDADKAREIYEDIVRRAKDPALLEYAGRDAFKLRIFPIEPRSAKRVKLRYSQVLPADNQLVNYVYPLNTEKFSAKALDDVVVKVEIDSEHPLRSIYSPSHDVEISRHGEKKALVSFEKSGVRPDRDFHLYFSRRREGIAVDLLTHRPDAAQEGFFMLMVSPGPLVETKDIQGKDICFVLDTSGSMMGAKLAQAKRSLLFCLENLNEDDRFEVIRFSTEAQPLFGDLRKLSAERRSEAKEFVGQFKAMGGTAIQEALDLALKSRPADAAGRPLSVLFLTDGLPTIGETRQDPIVDRVMKQSEAARIFTFGLGTDVNTHLLDRVAEGSGGRSQYVLPDEDLEVKLSAFYRKINNPAMTDLELAVTGSGIGLSSLYPKPLPNLFHGDQLLVFGRFAGQGAGAITLSGKVRGQKRRLSEDVTLPAKQEANAMIAEMWATRRVGWLLDEIRTNGESKELRDEIAALARRYGIVTPYTAYLIMDDEETREVPVARRTMREMQADQTVSARVEQDYESLRREAADEGARSGAQALYNVQNLQSLRFGKRPVAARPPQGTLVKSGAAGTSPDGAARASAATYAEQVRVIQGRAFYQNGGVWTDSTGQARTDLRVEKLPFNSDEYFKLLEVHPDAAQWLALGPRVDVVLGRTLYQIR